MRRLYSVVSNSTDHIQKEGDTISTWRMVNTVLLQTTSEKKVLEFVKDFIPLSQGRYQSADGNTQYCIL